MSSVNWTNPRASAVPVETLSHLLDDLAAVVVTVDPGVYIAKPASQSSGSIGAHVRHLLDHVAAFLETGSGSLLDYDRRERGTRIESDPGAALAQVFRLQRGLETMAGRQQDEHLRVRTQLSASGACITSWSTLGRELAFVINHTVHHHAIIGLLLAAHGEMPELDRFGYAASTPVAQ